MEINYDDLEQGLALEAFVLDAPQRGDVHSLPPKSYLEATVLPLLLHGLEAVAKDRPRDPVEYLAAFLLSNNPQRSLCVPLPPAPLLSGVNRSHNSAH
jgi:hypothetical protein